MASLLTFPLFRAFDANGAPLAGGKVYTYAAGTSTPLATYTTAAGNVPNANPTILDAGGEASIYLGTSPYKIDLTSALNVQQANFPVDNVLGTGAFFPVASVSVPSVDGAAILSATALIPAGAYVLTVATKVTIEFGTSKGLTGFAVGDGDLVDRWGVSAALTVNALTGSNDAPAAAQSRLSGLPIYTTATTVVLTALGGLFDGVGAVTVAPQYLSLPYRIA